MANSIVIEVENADIGVEWFHAGRETFDNMTEAARYMVALEGDERTRARMYVDGQPYADVENGELFVFGKGYMSPHDFIQHCNGPLLSVCMSIGGKVQWTGERRTRVLSHRCDSERDRVCVESLNKPGDFAELSSGVLVFVPQQPGSLQV